MSLILLTIIGGVTAQIIGWVWHGPLFGKKYGAAMGMNMSPENHVPMKAMIPALVLNFVANLVMAFVFFNLLGAFGAFAVAPALRTGLIVFIGFVLPLVTTNVLWNGRPMKDQWKLWGISFGYQIINMAVWAILFGLLA